MSSVSCPRLFSSVSSVVRRRGEEKAAGAELKTKKPKTKTPHSDVGNAGNSQRVKVLRLPRKSRSSCTKCCACHAKVAADAQSAAPATQKRAVPPGDQTRADNSSRVKVLRLPRKSSARCTQCCDCHTKAAGPSRRPNARRQLPESQSAAPATQK